MVPPTEFEKSGCPKRPGVRRFERIVRFATIGPVKAGWLIKSKGRWSATEEGRKAYERIQDPEKFEKESRRLYNQWAASRPDTTAEVADEGPDARKRFRGSGRGAWSEIETYMQNMPPYDFQNLVAALLRAMGYHVSWIAPPGPDKGMDILAHTDPLGTSVPRKGPGQTSRGRIQRGGPAFLYGGIGRPRMSGFSFPPEDLQPTQRRKPAPKKDGKSP